MQVGVLLVSILFWNVRADAFLAEVRVPTRPSSWIEVKGLGGAERIQNVHVRVRDDRRVVFFFDFEDKIVEIRGTKLRADGVIFAQNQIQLLTYSAAGPQTPRVLERVYLERIDRRHLIPQMLITAVVTFAATIGIPDLATSSILSLSSLSVLTYLAQLWSRPAGFSFRACALSLTMQ